MTLGCSLRAKSIKLLRDVRQLYGGILAVRAFDRIATPLTMDVSGKWTI